MAQLIFYYLVDFLYLQVVLVWFNLVHSIQWRLTLGVIIWRNKYNYCVMADVTPPLLFKIFLLYVMVFIRANKLFIPKRSGKNNFLHFNINTSILMDVKVVLWSTPPPHMFGQILLSGLGHNFFQYSLVKSMSKVENRMVGSDCYISSCIIHLPLIEK